MVPICCERGYSLSPRKVPGAGLRELCPGDHLTEWPHLGQATSSPRLSLANRCREVFASQADVGCWSTGAAQGTHPHSQTPVSPRTARPATFGISVSHRRHATLLLWDGDGHSPAGPSKSFPFPETQLPSVSWGWHNPDPEGLLSASGTRSTESTLDLAEPAECRCGCH